MAVKPEKQAAVTPAPRPILPCPVFTLGLDKRAIMYFDLFRCEVAYELSAYMFPDFWLRTILLESSRDISIHLSVLALAALSQTLFYSTSGSPTTCLGVDIRLQGRSPRPFVNEHHRMAVYYHTEAMHKIRKQLATQNQATSLRSLVLSTVLFVAFELLQGDLAAADRVLNNGLSVFQLAKTSDERCKLRHEPFINDTDPEVDIMLLYLSDVCGSSPSSPRQDHDRYAILELLPPIDYKIPESGYLDYEHLIRAWVAFSCRCVAFINQSASPTSSFDPDVAEIGRTKFLTKLHQWHETVTSLIETKNQERYMLNSMHENVEISRGTSRERPERLDRLRILQANIILLIIFFNCFPDESGGAFDGFTSDFQRVVDICATIMEHDTARSKSLNHFTLDRGMGILGSVASQCRDYDVRMKAYDLYRKITWKECGIYDFQILSLGKKAGIILEERSRSAAGLIQERFVCTKTSWDDTEGTFTAEFQRRTPDIFGNLVRVVASVDRATEEVQFEYVRA